MFSSQLMYYFLCWSLICCTAQETSYHKGQHSFLGVLSKESNWVPTCYLHRQIQYEPFFCHANRTWFVMKFSHFCSPKIFYFPTYGGVSSAALCVTSLSQIYIINAYCSYMYIIRCYTLFHASWTQTRGRILIDIWSSTTSE